MKVTFQNSVFVNCPYDIAYLSLFRPLLFTIHALGLNPRFALERSDSGEARLDKIQRLIQESRWGIHDLSRCRAAQAGELYRMNMPLELGLDLGCRFLGPTPMRAKRHLILEKRSFDYRKAISDLSGLDIQAHKDRPREMIRIVRNWLVQEAKAPNESPSRLWTMFNQFMGWNYDALKKLGYSDEDILLLPVNELSTRMADWLRSSSLARR